MFKNILDRSEADSFDYNSCTILNNKIICAGSKSSDRVCLSIGTLNSNDAVLWQTDVFPTDTNGNYLSIDQTYHYKVRIVEGNGVYVLAAHDWIYTKAANGDITTGWTKVQRLPQVTFESTPTYSTDLPYETWQTAAAHLIFTGDKFVLAVRSVHASGSNVHPFQDPNNPVLYSTDGTNWQLSGTRTRQSDGTWIQSGTTVPTCRRLAVSAPAQYLSNFTSGPLITRSLSNFTTHPGFANAVAFTDGQTGTENIWVAYDYADNPCDTSRYACSKFVARIKPSQQIQLRFNSKFIDNQTMDFVGGTGTYSEFMGNTYNHRGMYGQVDSTNHIWEYKIYVNGVEPTLTSSGAFATLPANQLSTIEFRIVEDIKYSASGPIRTTPHPTMPYSYTSGLNYDATDPNILSIVGEDMSQLPRKSGSGTARQSQGTTITIVSRG